VIDTSADKVSSWIELPGIAYGTAPTPDGKWLLVTLIKDNKVGVVDLNSMKVVRTLDVQGHHRKSSSAPTEPPPTSPATPVAKSLSWI